MPRSNGGGNQHVRRSAATSAACLLLAGWAALALPGTGAHAQGTEAASTGGGLIQRGVPAEATAEDAVQARDRAYAAAQRTAYSRMASELGLSPSASDSQINALVDSLVVESERTTRTGYSGRLTVRFNAGRVAALGGRVPASPGGGGAPVAGGAAPPVVPGGLAGNPGGGQPASTRIEAVARFASLPEWLALRSRLLAQPQVASVDILSIATDGARLRLGLRAPPTVAAAEMSGAGILLAPGTPAAAPAGIPGGTLGAPVPYGAPPPAPVPPGNAPWRVGLAGGA